MPTKKYTLSVSERQLVAILKALRWDAISYPYGPHAEKTFMAIDKQIQSQGYTKMKPYKTFAGKSNHYC